MSPTVAIGAILLKCHFVAGRCCSASDFLPGATTLTTQRWWHRQTQSKDPRLNPTESWNFLLLFPEQSTGKCKAASKQAKCLSFGFAISQLIFWVRREKVRGPRGRNFFRETAVGHNFERFLKMAFSDFRRG